VQRPPAPDGHEERVLSSDARVTRERWRPGACRGLQALPCATRALACACARARLPPPRLTVLWTPTPTVPGAAAGPVGVTAPSHAAVAT
jgi:hypothetical protein